MEFGILGPLEVSSGGWALDLGGPKQRALLLSETANSKAQRISCSSGSRRCW
jgi:hypothetical protein